MKKVSILIAAYNCELYIADALNSCIVQDYENIEVILVDDGSEDNTLGIAMAIAADNPWISIKVIKQKHLGAQKARNLALQYASGDYIQFLDADDILAANKISQQMMIAEENSDDCIISCRFLRFKNSVEQAYYAESSVNRDFAKASDWLKYSWLCDDMTTPHTWLIPKKLINQAGCWNERLLKNQDGEFLCRIILQAKSILFCQSTEVYYRLTGSGSVSKTFDIRSARSTLLSIDLYHKHILAKKLTGFDKAIASCYFHFWFFYFPHFSFLLIEAEQRSNSLGYCLIDFLAPGKLQKLARLIGLQRALSLRNWIEKKMN